MKLQYLGTGSSEGVPAVFCDCDCCAKARALGGKDIRTRSQALVDDTLLLDLPPDTYMHTLTHNLQLFGIGHILITHSHSDHFYPAELAKCRPPFAGKNGHKLTVYGNDKVVEIVEQLFEQDPELRDFCRVVELVPFQPVVIGNHTVTPLRALHNRKEACLNYLVTDGQKSLLYAHDTGIFPEDTWEFLKGKKLSLVSLDCNHQFEADGKNHMGLPDNIVVRRRLEELGAADSDTVFVANHFSHSGGRTHAEMEEAAASAGFITSCDGMTVCV